MFDLNRAELATDEYVPLTDIVMENFVILKKNPEYEALLDKDKALKDKRSARNINIYF